MSQDDTIRAEQSAVAGASPANASGLFQSEPRLLEAFYAGERRALSEVYLRCREPVQRVIAQGFTLRGNGVRYISGVNEPWEQEDILQEAFARAFSPRGRRGYDASKPYVPYLLQIVRNLRIDSLRSGRRYVLASPHPSLEDDRAEPSAVAAREPPLRPHHEAAQGTIEEELDRARYCRALQRCLEGFDEQRRDFVALRFFEALSQQDTANAMGIGRRRVRTLEARVLGEFRCQCRNGSHRLAVCAHLPARVPAETAEIEMD